MSTIAAGTTSTTALVSTGDTTGKLTFQTNGTTTAMTIDTSQNVGIGTSAPAAKLEIDYAATGNGITSPFDQETLVLKNTNSTANNCTSIQARNAGGGAVAAINFINVGTGAYPNNGGGIAFATYAGSGAGGTTKMYLDPSGNVGIGTSSPTSISGFTSVTVNNATTGGLIDVQCNGATVGRLYANSNVAYLYNQSSNPLVFGTGGLEKMRIDSSGNLLVGTTSASNSGSGTRMQIAYDGGGTQYGLGFRPTTNTTVPIQFGNASGATVGTISQDASNVAYNTSSDYRLKENIVPMTGALAKVAALKPCTYNWKLDGSAGQGFIAHELAEVCPQAVTGKKDAVDENGKPVYQGVDTSFLVATLTAAIQEQQQQIDALKAEFDAYKAAHP